MKIKRITSWILCVAMIMTMLPATVFAATSVPGTEATCPVITATMYVQDGTKPAGDDLLMFGENTYDAGNGVQYNDSAREYADEDNAWQQADIKASTTPTSRRQALSINLLSNSNGEFGVNHMLEDNAIKYAFMDLDKNYLVMNSDGLFESNSTEDPWTSYMDLPYSKMSIEEFNNTGDLSTTRAINQQLAANNRATVVIWNIIKTDFEGYIRIRVEDTKKYITYQDILVVADGKYPTVDIVSQTFKPEIGGDVAKESNETVIQGRVYREYLDEKNEVVNQEIASPWFDENGRDENMMKTINSYILEEKYWANDDINVTINANDEYISSELKSLKWELYNTKNVVLENDKTNLVVGGTGTIDAPDYENGINNPVNSQLTANVLIEDEGQNTLIVTAEDKAGLRVIYYYYFFIDKTAPEAKFDLVESDKNVVSLFTAADVVTNREQSIDMDASADVKKNVAIISDLREHTPGDADANKMYQYRLLATKAGEPATDADADGVIDVTKGDIPEGYTTSAPADTNLEYGVWTAWNGDDKIVIGEEFDGIIQVRVQDKAGNWSPIISETRDGKETIITDNTNPVITVKEYALNSNGDTTGYSADEIFDGSAQDILAYTGAPVVTYDAEKNEEIHTTEGVVAPWINDTAVMEVKITDKDLINEIRSSGLGKPFINIKAEFNGENENKKVAIWNNNKTDKEEIKDSFDVTSEYIFGSETDKELIFYIEYEGTGAADITVSVKDQADVNDGDSFSAIYKAQLRVDKINPYITFKGYDITDEKCEDLLSVNTPKADYEHRDMPWGPNSQVLEVVVKDDDITAVQSKTNNIRFNADKAVDMYVFDGDVFTYVTSFNAGINTVDLNKCMEIANDKYESNIGYQFYLVYEGTGIAKVEFYAEDSAKEPNVRDYPSVATSGDAEVVSYDAMLRVDTIKPEFASVALVETDADVKDTGWILSLFTFDETDVDVNTRKQMKLAFEIVDETDTVEQSGVNIQSEKITGTDLMEVRGKYVENTKKHLYNNKPTSYVTDDANDKDVDPYIDYILLPEEVGEINGVGGTYEAPSSMSNEDIEKLVEKYIDKEYNAAGDKCQWKKASWKDGGIVVPDEFQGAIVLRVADRVGNVEYSAPITFVAESRNPVIDFNPQNGYIYAQNNYGWSKRDYDYVEIRVKDNNEEMVDAWLENVFIKVTDLEGNDISTKDTVSFAHLIHQNDATAEVNPTLDDYVYDSLSGYAYEADYGYDVIDTDGIVETIARDSEGYIHLGYVRLAESAQITVTVFDKAKHEGAEYTGNKTTGVWTTRFDRTAPVVTEFDLVPLYDGTDNNNFGIKLSAEDDLSGIAPAITDSAYNKYASENIPAAGVFGTDGSYLYTRDNTADERTEIFNAGTFNPRQYELPGLQYALIPGNGYLEDVAPWDFETAPVYTAEGYNGEMGATYVWHNYVNDETSVVPAEFDGLIVVRAIDKAGNITVIGYSSILDVEADDDWNNETQFIQVRTDEKWTDGVITNVQYYGNNNLLFPKDMRKDLSNSLNNGEGAIIEVAEEGITNVVITATEVFVDGKDITATKDARDAAWEGAMNIGNATATGYEDWKYQLVDVKIDKTAPVLSFNLIDENGKAIADAAVTGEVTIKAIDLEDPIPNMPDELGYRSHIASGIAKVEWCAVAEGSSEEKWIAVDDWSDGELGVLDADAFTGTVKVRVTDNAGNETVKSQRIKIDNVNAIVNVSKSYNTLYSREPVDVFVTVTPNAEFSDVKEVTYVVTNPDGSETKGTLPLIGGTISIDAEGESKVVVTAVTKAGVTASDDTVVRIDRTAPEFKLHVEDSKGSVVDKPTQEIVKVTITDLKEDVSGVKTVEWCKVPAGSSEEKWEEAYDWEAGEIGEVDANAFTGTVKVRVVDNAGNETIKSQLIKIDNEAANISISKSYSTKCSNKPVEVYVTVSENGEFSDVKEVTYVVTNIHGSETKGTLPLIGGTISIDAEDESKVVVTAKTKAGVTATAETTVKIHYYSSLARPSLKDLKSVDWVNTNTVAVVPTSYDVYYSLNGSEWFIVDANTNIIEGLNVGENEIRLQARSECSCTSDIATYIISYDDGANIPYIDVIYNDDDVNNWTKDSVVVNISANKADSVSDIASIKYTVSQNGTDKSYDGYLGANGGNVVIQNEGIWILSDIIVTMESGIQYFISDGKETNVDGKDDNVGIETFGSLKNISMMITVDEEGKVLPDENVAEVVVAKIDRTAPVVDEGAFELIGTGNEAEYEYGMDLFSIEDVVESNETLKLKVDPAKITDNLSWITSYEYAVLPVGRTVPTWKKYYAPDDGESVSKISKINRYFELSKKSELTEAEEKELDKLTVDYAKITAAMPVVVDRAFEGSVLLKVTDNAGNETIVSKTVKTEGIAPEISISAPSGWQTEDFMVDVKIADIGVSSEIEEVKYHLFDIRNKSWDSIESEKEEIKIDGEEVEVEKWKQTVRNSMKEIPTIGGSIEITDNGEFMLAVYARDWAGNESFAKSEVRLDKVSPEYSGMVQLLGTYNEHVIPERELNIIHDGWTYNHDVSLEGIVDEHSGIKKVEIKFTSDDGAIAETSLTEYQTNCSFTESGKYDLVMTDKAGNVRNISFTINTKLENVINVVAVDKNGRINIAVTDGDEMLTFTKKENSKTSFQTMYNGITDQIWDGKTGVRYIQAKNDAGKKTNTLYVIVAPSAEYGVSLMNISETPNRYLDFAVDGQDVTVVKKSELFNGSVNAEVEADGSTISLCEDGIYQITTR